MLKRHALLLTLGIMLGCGFGLSAQTDTKSDPKAELKELVGRINEKLGSAKQVTEALLAPELEEFEVLLKRHEGDKSEGVALILEKKYQLYQNVLKDSGKAMVELRRLAREFPDTDIGKRAPKIIAQMQIDPEVKELVGRINKKLSGDDPITEAHLAPELKEFEELLKRHEGDKSEDVAFILVMKLQLYLEVLKDREKAIIELKRLAKDFPETEIGKNAPTVIARMQTQAEKEKVARSLVPGSQFPEFEEMDIAGKPVSIKGVKARAILIDFWATWCGPCRAELPNVKAAYDKYHSKGFEIIGINLDEDMAALTSFLKRQDMTWPQHSDGKGWEGKLVGQYGVVGIPATFLLDGNGKIIAKDLRGPELEEALEKLLGK